MTAPLLSARGLGIGYPGKAVGRDLDIDVRAGEVICLLGPNGSGKTTLFKTLLGLLPAQAGEIRIEGEASAALTRTEIARRIAYVPQAHSAHFPYRVLDMVTMGRTAHLGLFSTPSNADRALARAALDRLGISDLADVPYTRISGGQRQLALIARALAQDTRIIVMDEPTASLDFGNQVVVLSEITRLAARDLAIVLSTHDPDHAFAVATRVVLLKQGSVIAEGAPVDVLTPERLLEVYGVAVAIERSSAGGHYCVPQLGP